jgi:hypothetical protein
MEELKKITTRIALAVQGLHLFISYFSPGSNIECY